MTTNCLIHDRDNEYTLPPDEDTVWITVGEFSIHIVNSKEKLTTAIYPAGYELEDAISVAVVKKNLE